MGVMKNGEVGHESIPLNGAGAAFAGTDAHQVADFGDPHFAVADFFGTGGVYDCFNYGVGLVVVYDNLYPCFGGEEHLVFGTSVGFAVASLSAEALNFTNRHALDAHCGKAVFYIVEFEGFDYCGY